MGAGVMVETDDRRGGLRQPLRAGLLALVRGPAFLALALAGLCLLIVPVLVPAMAVLGLLALTSWTPRLGLMVAVLFWAGDLVVVRYGVLGALMGTRRLAQLTRRLSDEWLGLAIPDSYLPATEDDAERLSANRLRWMMSDPATWRDLLWMATNASFGWFLAMVPVALAAAGLIGVVGYGIVGMLHGSALVRIVFGLAGVAVTALAVWSAPLSLQAYGALARAVLGPRKDRELVQRVQHLAQTRAESIDASAAEIRRIERDLHDGTQARLVAMGMALGAAEDLFETDPEATHKLLAETRQTSSLALAELRALVSGIHPPVLADRGLVDAIRALALDSVPRVEVTAEPTIRRLSAPVESAAYFAVSELLANVSKHAEARQAWVDFGYAHGMLAICVTDDGRGGADPARGTGLGGIERRLAAFDGTLKLSSPSGGPTIVQLEIPCELS
jgi:signal transduction histidine kinase